MKVFKSIKAFQKFRKSKNFRKKTIAFVPTMGALHAGHLKLVKKARTKADFTVVSIYVNPSQFAPSEDFSKYPRQLKKDLKLLKSAKVDAVFAPEDPLELYPRGLNAKDTFKIQPPEALDQILEGEFRPGHFSGVATVVLKLFEIVRPNFAFFGEKDFQQLKVIEALVEEFFLPVKIESVKTVREDSGLALSSRNAYLDPEARKRAAFLHTVLKSSRSPEQAARELEVANFKVDYVRDWKKRRLAAVRFAGVRLIDNVSAPFDGKG